MPPQFRDRTQCSQCNSREAATHHAHDDCALECNIGSREARNRGSNPDAERNGNTDEQDDLNLLARAANLIAKQNGLEITRTHYGAGNGGNHAKPDKQSDKY